MPDFGPDISLDQPAYIDPSALMYGKVALAEGASLWPYAVIRAEFFGVEIGIHSNVQDHCMIHVGEEGSTVIGAHCSITHHCTIHGATIGDNCLIGINATLMDGVVVGENCIIAGGSFLTAGTVIPENSVVMGVPGKVVRRQNNFVAGRFNAAIYHFNALAYARGDHRAWASPEYAEFAEAERARIEAEFRKLYPDDEPAA
ncbi:MAG: gamma carbonic anhydrase family protein [Alphaproteobacteria bacterium]